MNWGGFAGGLAAGLGDAYRLGKAFGDAEVEKELAGVRASGLDKARSVRETAINEMIQAGSLNQAAGGLSSDQVQADTTSPSNPAGLQPSGAVTAPVRTAEVTPVALEPQGNRPGASADGNAGEAEARAFAARQQAITPQASETASAKPVTAGSTASPTAPAAAGLPFTVGGKGYATSEEARAAAEKSVGSEMDFFAKHGTPMVQDWYMKRGEIDKAEAYGKWAEERKSKEDMKQWAKAYRAAQMGNIEKAADHVFNLYKRYDDGITPVSKEVVKDKEGNITGFNVRLKTDATGEERTQFIDKKALTEMGLAALSPPKMFEMQFQRQAEADKAAAANASKIAEEVRAEGRDIRKEGRGEGRDIRKDTRAQANAIEKLTIEKQLEAANASGKARRDVEAKIQILRDSGTMTEEELKSAIPSLIIGAQFKKGASPEEAARLAHDALMKSDPMFSRKSEAEKQKAVEAVMRINQAASAIGAKRPAAVGGLPAAGDQPAAAQAKKGVPVYDTKTGQIIYR